MFVFLTALMTWPWVTDIRAHVTDPGDPYLNSWILWWDWHQTFTDPLNLFHGNILFPYRYSLAFSEHNYGIALLLFPFFALGVKPLTAHGIAVLLAFVLSGYGAFRLTRTLTGSVLASLVAGVAFAYTPFRFVHITHVNYLFAAWVPLLVEALVLFARDRSRKRALWLGVAFLMNGLTCIHWFVLSAVPFALVALFLAIRAGLVTDRKLLVRGGTALVFASLLLLPFLVPYQKVARLYGFVRNETETLHYSAALKDWLTADPANRTWGSFGERPLPPERQLFPGVAAPLLALAALLLGVARPGPQERAPDEPGARRRLLSLLDAVAVAAGTIALLASSASGFVVRWGERSLFQATDSTRAAAILIVALLVRWTIAWPRVFTWVRQPSLLESVRRTPRPEAFWIGAIFLVTGFLGSFGLRGPFHRLLWEFVPIFRSIRAPSRWAMMAGLGLAVLAGLGALELSRSIRRGARAPRAGVFALCAVSVGALLFDARVAPFSLVKGAVDPDDVTRFLASTPMTGGIVELPSTTYPVVYEATLRAADHGKPLVNAISGFEPPTMLRINELTTRRPIPDETLDFLESIPTSYLVVHDARIDPEDRRAWRDFLGRGIDSGRLRFIARFDGNRRNDVYAVTRAEPGARSLAPLPWRPLLGEVGPGSGRRVDDLSLIGSIDDPAPDREVKGTFRVFGWARVPGEDLDVTIVIDGEVRTPLSFRRLARPDVAQVLPEMGDTSASGYEAVFAFQTGDEGAHELFVVFRAKDGRVRFFPARRFVWKP